MSERPSKLQLRSLIHIPDDLLIEILTRLPVKSIFKSKCVCKHWCSLIQDPAFSHFHSLQAKKRLTALCRQCDSDSKGNYLYSSDGFGAEFHQTLKLSLFDKFINSCNGLFCYLGDSGDRIKVCNPITREIIVLPRPNGLREEGKFARVGLGFDSSRRKYKVVCWIGGVKQNDSTIEVLTLGNKTKLWRKTTTTTMHVDATVYCDKPIYVNGTLHWDTRKVDYKNGFSKCTIYSFDVRDEKVRKVSGPDLNVFNKKHWICEFQGCLGLIHRAIGNEKRVNMWVLADCEKCTWVHKHIIFPDNSIWEDVVIATKPWSIIKQTRSVIVQNGEISVLLCEGKCWHISQYDEYGKLLKRIEIVGLPSGTTPSLHYHVENLVSFRYRCSYVL